MNTPIQFSQQDALDALRRSAQDMAALLSGILTQLQAEPGLISHISQQRIDDAIARHACAEQLLVTAKAATTVRVHKLHGLLETKALNALIQARCPDADTIVTTRIARRWLAAAYRECAADVIATFPDQSKAPQPHSASARAH